jgi:hypothetical protein
MTKPTAKPPEPPVADDTEDLWGGLFGWMLDEPAPSVPAEDTKPPGKPKKPSALTFHRRLCLSTPDKLEYRRT